MTAKGEAALAQPEAEPAGEPPEDRRPSRLKVWLRFLRLRVAHAVLLPELSPDEARTLRQAVHDDGDLTPGYILMCALSAGIAMLGLLQSSTAVVIGAMLISPLMGPIAALGFGFASIDGARIREAARVLAIGAFIGVLTGVLLTWASPIRNATPEILARTQPTLLDLAVALFSGIAGGYATVIGKGGTAIGVAIATALMPPLATLGYGIGVLQPRFALGALLLFLTNLAAIAFAFAMIARLSGAAKPLYAVEWTPRHFIALVLAFLVLATPLSMTLMRIKHEATIRSAARSAILAATGDNSARIAQIDVNSPMFGTAQVDALVITRRYGENAVKTVEATLAKQLGEPVTVNLQQVLAADVQAQTRAMVDAAMERTIAGISADVPPIDKIRSAIGTPTRAAWTNSAAKMVYVEPFPVPGWTLADYAELERRAKGADPVWSVRVVPPVTGGLKVRLAETATGEDTVSTELAIWALQRWGVSHVTLTAPGGPGAVALARVLGDAGITVTSVAAAPPEEGAPPAEESVATLGVYAPRPSIPVIAPSAVPSVEASAAAAVGSAQ